MLSHICSSIFKLYLINLITNQYLTLLFSFLVSLASCLSPHHSPCLSRLPLGPEAQGRAMLSAVDVDHLKQRNTNNFKKDSSKRNLNLFNFQIRPFSNVLTFSFLRTPFETFSTHLASSWSLWWLWLTLAQEEETHLAGRKQNPTETGETDQITSEGPSNNKFCRFPSNNMCQVWIKQNTIQTFSSPSELSKESYTDHDELSLPYFYVANRGHRAPGALRLRVHTSTTRWFPEMN